MTLKNSHYFSVFAPSVLLGFVAALQLTGCGDTPVGIVEAAGAAGQSAQGGDSTSEAGRDHGEAGEAGEAGETAGGSTHSHPHGGSTASAGSTAGGAGGTLGEAGGTTSGTGGVADGAGGTTSGGSAGTLIGAGSGGQGGTLLEAVIPPTCMFHTDASISVGGADGSAGGAGASAGGSAGAGGTGLTVTVQVSPFVGTYLADAAGRTLYTYGNDLPGDCNTPPVSNCITDCLISWPIFPAGARVLAPGLDEAAFGAILRNDGTWQTTYYGWPIYYYKTDLLLGQVAGQGKAKTWHIVEKKPPGVTIMKPGSFRYLADAAGHTLYVSSADQAGTLLTDPVSNCSGTCLTTFEPFHEKNISIVTSLLMADFGSFVRPGKSRIHVAYKGMPLYRAATDLKSGDMTGTSVSGFTAALP